MGIIYERCKNDGIVSLGLKGLISRENQLKNWDCYLFAALFMLIWLSEAPLIRIKCATSAYDHGLETELTVKAHIIYLYYVLRRFRYLKLINTLSNIKCYSHITAGCIDVLCLERGRVQGSATRICNPPWETSCVVDELIQLLRQNNWDIRIYKHNF